jgi:hypothetical protein
MAGLPDRATPPQAEQAKRLAAMRERIYDTARTYFTKNY